MRYLLLAPIIVLLLSACKPAVVDEELPTAQIESPANGNTVYTAEGIRVVATLKDNTGLLQYKLTISGIDSLNDISADSVFEKIIVEGIDEINSLFLDYTIPLPENAYNGRCKLTLTCLDIEGNESIMDTTMFEIKNSIDSDPPVISVTGPIQGDTLKIGSGFLTLGKVIDTQLLVYSEIFIGRSDFSDTIRFTTFPWISNNLVDYDAFSWWTQVDSTWSQGDYHIYLTAWDNYSGVSHSIPFHVSY